MTSRLDWPDYFESWDEYFLAIAETVARKSKDPRCKVGAVIVSPDKLILSTGFNGLARGVFDVDDILQDAEEKLRWICHAEVNAILNAARIGVSLKGTSIAVTKFPCLACCNAIVQAGIHRIYTHDNRYWDDDPADSDHTRKPAILKQGSVEVVAPFHPQFAPKDPLRWAAKAEESRKGPARAPGLSIPLAPSEAKESTEQLAEPAVQKSAEK